MSGRTAWAQCIPPQTAAAGLYWKNMWYMPFQKIGPLGSFIQFFAGSKWNCGRSGSGARRPATSSPAEKFKLRRKCGVAAAAIGVDSNFFKNLRREEVKRASAREVCPQKPNQPTVECGSRTPALRVEVTPDCKSGSQAAALHTRKPPMSWLRVRHRHRADGAPRVPGRGRPWCRTAAERRPGRRWPREWH